MIKVSGGDAEAMDIFGMGSDGEIENIADKRLFGPNADASQIDGIVLVDTSPPAKGPEQRHKINAATIGNEVELIYQQYIKADPSADSTPEAKVALKQIIREKLEAFLGSDIESVEIEGRKLLLENPPSDHELTLFKKLKAQGSPYRDKPVLVLGVHPDRYPEYQHMDAPNCLIEDIERSSNSDPLLRNLISSARGNTPLSSPGEGRKV